MANLIIFEINLNAVTPEIELKFKEVAKYYARFEKHSIAFLLDNQPDVISNIAFDLDEIIIDKHLLSEVAKNRLVNNLIDNFPELVITMLDCAEKSYLVKVRKRTCLKNEAILKNYTN